MRRIARIAGLAWLALSGVAGLVLGTAQTMVRAGAFSSSRGLIYLVFAAALPGILLYRWGRGPYRRPIPTREIVERAYPAKTAREMGHVERIK